MGITQLMTVSELIEALREASPDTVVFVACENGPIAHPLGAIAKGVDLGGSNVLLLTEGGYAMFELAKTLGMPYMVDRKTDADTAPADTAPADTDDDTAECPPLTDDDNERLDDFKGFLDRLDN